MQNASATPHILQEAPDFSLVLGGPLYQLWRRAHLADDALRRMLRRILAMVMVAWLPLLLLASAQGNLWGDNVELPFLHDIELHIRLLFALPLLVVAELVVHQRMRPMVGHFLASGLIRDETRADFVAAVDSALRLRNSVAAEVSLLAFVYVVGVLFFWPSLVALDTSAWYGSFHPGAIEPTLAGWWLALVSLPLFQFILLRWYWRTADRQRRYPVAGRHESQLQHHQGDASGPVQPDDDLPTGADHPDSRSAVVADDHAAGATAGCSREDAVLTGADA